MNTCGGSCRSMALPCRSTVFRAAPLSIEIVHTPVHRHLTVLNSPKKLEDRTLSIIPQAGNHVGAGTQRSRLKALYRLPKQVSYMQRVPLSIDCGHLLWEIAQNNRGKSFTARCCVRIEISSCHLGSAAFGSVKFFCFSRGSGVNRDPIGGGPSGGP